MTTWRKLFEDAFVDTGDSFADLICTLTDEEIDQEFPEGYTGFEGMSFTAWSKDYVYFPCCYDGAEWVGWTYRNPCDKPTPHQGGG